VAENPSQSFSIGDEPTLMVSSILSRAKQLPLTNISTMLNRVKNLLEENDIAITQESQIPFSQIPMSQFSTRQFPT